MGEIEINIDDNLNDFDRADLADWLEANPSHGFARIVSAFLVRVAEEEKEKNPPSSQDEFPF